MTDIVFMGTPDFALPSLEAMNERHNVKAVFCQPDKASGRGNKITPCPVKSYAEKNGIPVFQPQSFKDESTRKTLENLAPDLIVVAAYGKLLPEYVLELPKYGCINVHGSLLPKYRGASPIQRAVLNGDKTTGVTVMKMGVGLDTGDVISQTELEIGEYETAGELFDRMSRAGADLLSDTVEDIICGRAVFSPQNDAAASFAPIITKQMGKLDFSAPARCVKNTVYGYNPWPSAYVECKSGMLKIHRVIMGGVTESPAGSIISVSKRGIEVACGDGNSVVITELQRVGKKKMDAYSFSLGAKIEKGASIYSL